MSADVRGEVGLDDGVLMIKRIHGRYRLRAPEDTHETVERVHGIHKRHGPVYRSLEGAIEITTELELVA